MSYRVELEPEDLHSVRRHGPGMRTAVALLVMAVAAGGAWAGWRTLHHGAAGGAIPVIRADAGPLKVPPANPGGMHVPDQNIYVLNGVTPPDSKVEQLLPPPETPLPRPAPAAPEPSAAAVPLAAPAPQDAAVAAPAAAPLQSAAVAAPAVASAAPPPAAPTPAAVPAAAPAPAPIAAPAGGFRLQLAALRSPDAVMPEWNRLKRVQADLLGALDMRSVRADLGARGVFYRIEAGPIASEEVAARLCTELKARKVGCILVRP